jgi:hypothetical protein
MINALIVNGLRIQKLEGVHQRKPVAQKGKNPHSITITPLKRSDATFCHNPRGWVGL